MIMPAKEWACQQEQAGKSKSFFLVHYLGGHQKVWPTLKMDLPTPKDLDKSGSSTSKDLIKKSSSQVYLASWGLGNSRCS